MEEPRMRMKIFFMSCLMILMMFSLVIMSDDFRLMTRDSFSNMAQIEDPDSLGSSSFVRESKFSYDLFGYYGPVLVAPLFLALLSALILFGTSRFVFSFYPSFALTSLFIFSLPFFRSFTPGIVDSQGLFMIMSLCFMSLCMILFILIGGKKWFWGWFAVVSFFLPIPILFILDMLKVWDFGLGGAWALLLGGSGVVAELSPIFGQSWAFSCIFTGVLLILGVYGYFSSDRRMRLFLFPVYVSAVSLSLISLIWARFFFLAIPSIVLLSGCFFQKVFSGRPMVVFWRVFLVLVALMVMFSAPFYPSVSSFGPEFDMASEFINERPESCMITFWDEGAFFLYSTDKAILFHSYPFRLRDQNSFFADGSKDLYEGIPRGCLVFWHDRDRRKIRSDHRLWIEDQKKSAVQFCHQGSCGYIWTKEVLKWV